MLHVSLQPAWQDRHFDIVSPFGTAPSPVPWPPAQTNDPFNGTSSNDTITGTGNADSFDMAQGGNDKVYGGDGDDTFDFGNTFASGDTVRGGDGFDTLNLSGGSYAAGLSIPESMLSGVEQINLADGNNYTLTFLPGAAHNVTRMAVNGYAIGAAHHITIDASALSNDLSLQGSFGNDTLAGGSGDDWLYSGPASASSNDTLTGNNGDDIFLFSSDLTSGDRVFGGSGSDLLSVAGDYSAGLTLGSFVKGVEGIQVNDNFTYDLATTDALVAAGTQFVVETFNLGTHHLTFDGSAETNGSFRFETEGGDILTGGQGADVFHIYNPGGTMRGGDGDDAFDFFGSYDDGTKVFGGNGHDVVAISQGLGAPATLTGVNFSGIEELDLSGGASTFAIDTADSLLGLGKLLTIDGSGLGGGGLLHFDGSAETNGHFDIIGGTDIDNITGGAKGDTLQGGALADTLKGGGGDDTFVYTTVLESFGGGPDAPGFDTIVGFDASADGFHFPFVPTGVDPRLTSGHLSASNLAGDLVTALDGKLHANHAILFQPNHGDLAGSTFLIVDANGTPGYQEDHDYVIELKSPLHLNHFDDGNFN